MVLFSKGCSTKTLEDGGHQEGEVQAVWEEHSKLQLQHFSMCFEKGCNDEKDSDVTAG